MWRHAILSNSGVKMLKGLQFGMLDEDNDGEVSLADITRAVFRRANDRDLPRIRRFLEVIFNHKKRGHGCPVYFDIIESYTYGGMLYNGYVEGIYAR